MRKAERRIKDIMTKIENKEKKENKEDNKKNKEKE